MYMRRALLLWPGVVAAAVQLGRGSYVALVTPMDAANAVDYGACGLCGNQPVCRVHPIILH